MDNFEIGIIGGTGGIGAWFAAFFTAEGYRVHVTGRHTGISLPEMAARCAVVIVAVPVAETVGVIRRAGTLLPSNALLMDFTSLKETPVREMLAATAAEVVGCHPLFGPFVPSLTGQNICLCPGRGEQWLTWLEGLFAKSGARVTVTTPLEHDRMMALVQGLPHLETVLLGLTLRAAGAEASDLEAFSTPVFRTRQALSEKVFGSRPGLYAALIAENPNMPAILEIYERNLALLKDLILKGDTAAIGALLKKP